MDKILIYSPQFYPRIGGVERVTQLLAQAWAKAGHQVTVVSQTPVPVTEPDDFAFEISRCPSLGQLYQRLRDCDLYVQSCISLKGLWPWLLVKKPLVMIHHTWYRRPDGRMSWQDQLKLHVTRWGHNIAVSEAIAAHLPVVAQVIENPYDAAVFYPRPEIGRDRDFVFVGRLVSDKGVDLLITALGHLQEQGLNPTLTIIGSGPERPALEAQIQHLNLIPQVSFLGDLSPQRVAESLCQHQFLVVPSRWQEPFGIVALEGIACGCFVVGSNQGGLGSAIGPAGWTFDNGDVRQLTTRLTQLLTEKPPWQGDLADITDHLRRHHPTTVAQCYLDQLRTVGELW